MNFRNRMKTWETEQRVLADQKEKERAQVRQAYPGRIEFPHLAPHLTPALSHFLYLLSQAEFDAEREYLQTISLLSPEEQQRYKDRQSISFMYQVWQGVES